MTSNDRFPPGHAGATDEWRVVLARRRPPTADPEETPEGAKTHLLPLPLGSAPTLCGVELDSGEIQTVEPGQGLWCTACFVVQATGEYPMPFPPGSSGTGGDCVAAGVAYRALGWPIVPHAEQVSLNLDCDPDAVALVIPALVGAEVTEILVRRRCTPAVFAHPSMPGHRVVLAGERYPVPLNWPTGVHRVTGTVLLPPSLTTRGPLFWVHPPVPHTLKLCREIDVFAALRTAMAGLSQARAFSSRRPGGSDSRHPA